MSNCPSCDLDYSCCTCTTTEIQQAYKDQDRARRMKDLTPDDIKWIKANC